MKAGMRMRGGWSEVMVWIVTEHDSREYWIAHLVRARTKETAKRAVEKHVGKQLQQWYASVCQDEGKPRVLRSLGLRSG